MMPTKFLIVVFALFMLVVVVAAAEEDCSLATRIRDDCQKCCSKKGQSFKYWHRASFDPFQCKCLDRPSPTAPGC